MLSLENYIYLYQNSLFINKSMWNYTLKVNPHPHYLKAKGLRKNFSCLTERTSLKTQDIIMMKIDFQFQKICSCVSQWYRGLEVYV